MLTQTATFAITQINPNEFVDQLQFNQLNPSVGTLQEIAISWSGSQEDFVTIESATGGAWNLDLANDLRLSDADTFALLANAIDPDLSGVLGASSPSPLQGGPMTFTGGTGIFSTDNALYEGTGTVDLTLTEGVVNTLFNSGPSDVESFGGSSASSGTVDLDYIYTPTTAVPEPSSAALLTSLGGLMLIVGQRYRRKRLDHAAPVA